MDRNATLIEFLDRCPPVMARFMAYHSGRGKKTKLKTIDEISRESGLSKRMVQRLAFKPNWSGVKADVASQFLVGCEVNILVNCPSKTSNDNRKYIYRFFQQELQRGMPHLNKEQRRRFYKLMGIKP
jgi:hypothetical protein